MGTVRCVSSHDEFAVPVIVSLFLSEIKGNRQNNDSPVPVSGATTPPCHLNNKSMKSSRFLMKRAHLHNIGRFQCFPFQVDSQISTCSHHQNTGNFLVMHFDLLPGMIVNDFTHTCTCVLTLISIAFCVYRYMYCLFLPLMLFTITHRMHYTSASHLHCETRDIT